MTAFSAAYLKELRRRSKESRVYRKYQLTGLAIAETLHDERHKSLYIKLAKEGNGERLFALAREVAQNRHVKNRGAYFMALIKTLRGEKQHSDERGNTKKNEGNAG